MTQQQGFRYPPYPGYGDSNFCTEAGTCYSGAVVTDSRDGFDYILSKLRTVPPPAFPDGDQSSLGLYENPWSELAESDRLERRRTELRQLQALSKTRLEQQLENRRELARPLGSTPSASKALRRDRQPIANPEGSTTSESLSTSMMSVVPRNDLSYPGKAKAMPKEEAVGPNDPTLTVAIAVTPTEPVPASAPPSDDPPSPGKANSLRKDEAGSTDDSLPTVGIAAEPGEIAPVVPASSGQIGHVISKGKRWFASHFKLPRTRGENA